MIDDAVDFIGTAIIFVAPVVLVLVGIIVVVAYPWLLVIPVGLWWHAGAWKGAGTNADEPTALQVSPKPTLAMPKTGTSRS